MSIENIIHEWFANLPKGFATYPYSESELLILKEVLERNKMSPALVHRIRMDYLKEGQERLEKEKENPQAPTEKQPAKEPEIKSVKPEVPETRFVAKTAPFMQTFVAFEDLLNQRYLSAGIEVENLTELYAQILSAPPETNKRIIKMIHENTNRELVNGTFKLGEYELELLRIINSTIRIKNHVPHDLWAAIIYNGKVQSNELVNNILVAHETLTVRNFNNTDQTDFGTLPPELDSYFRKIINLNAILLDQEINPNIDRDGVNNLLVKLGTPETIADIQKVINLAKTTEDNVIARLGKSYETLLNGTSVQEIVATFCQKVNEMIYQLLKVHNYWAVIVRGKFYVAPAEDIFDKLKCKNNKLSKAVLNFGDSHLWIDSREIYEEIVE